MNYRILFLFVGIYFVSILSAVTIMSNSSGPTQDYTGAPGSAGNCSNCHSGLANNSGVTLDGLPGNGYEAGETYTLTLSIDNPTSTNGFQLIGLDGSNAQAGSFSSGTGSKLQPIGGKSYIEHSSPSSSGQWEFDWTAPGQDVGTITFYASTNAADGNGTANNADEVYYDSFELQPSTATGLAEFTSEDFEIFPNPVQDYIKVNGTYSNQVKRANIYTMSGKLVKAVVLNSGRVDVSDLPGGVFIFHPKGTKWTKTFVKSE